MKFNITIILLLLLVAVPTFAQDDAATVDAQTPTEICEEATPATEPETREYAEPEQVIEDGIDYRAIICTSAGPVYIDLFEEYTPITVNNFVFLAEADYFNNTIFHRVIEDFMVQGGDPTGTGSGGPGYRFVDEVVGFLTFDRTGVLAMANSGPATNGSQFFITTAETPWLNGDHTIFGEVLEGQAELVDNVLLRDPQVGGDATTLDTVVIITDPALVDTTFEETAEVATADDFLAGLNILNNPETLPEDLAFNAEILTTDDVASIAPDDLQEGYGEFLAEYGHDYRVSGLLENVNCNTDYFFTMMSYTVDAFASADDASAALDDEFLPSYYEAVNYVPFDTGGSQLNAYRSDAEVCGEGEIIVSIDLQRGRYITNISVVYAASMLDQLSEAELALVTTTNVALLLESGLGDAYRSELR